MYERNRKCIDELSLPYNQCQPTLSMYVVTRRRRRQMTWINFLLRIAYISSYNITRANCTRSIANMNGKCFAQCRNMNKVHYRRNKGNLTSIRSSTVFTDPKRTGASALRKIFWHQRRGRKRDAGGELRSMPSHYIEKTIEGNNSVIYL